MILFSIVTVILETEPLVYLKYASVFDALNMLIVSVFLAEYIFVSG